MNEMTVPRTGTAVSAELLSKLKSGIAESRATMPAGSGKPLLRLLKTADWVYGQNDTPVQENSSWAANPLSFQHGWVAWSNSDDRSAKNTLMGEVMTSITEPRPLRPPPIENWPFSEQRIVEFRCLDGDDIGKEVVYKTPSKGGLNALDKLLQSLQVQLDENPAYPCPVVIFSSDSYNHPKFGKTVIPVLEVVDWSSMDGKLLSEAAAIEAAPTAPRRGRPPNAAPAPAPAEPEPTARRRPLRRG